MPTRTDIKQCDVFVSWTSADRDLKNRIVEYLTEKGISCLESDKSCSGDYRQWSRESVGACSVFLPIITANAKNSTYMPIEVEEVLLLDDYKNRIVPICESRELYNAFSFGLSEFCSAVFMEGALTLDDLDKLYNKIKSLLINWYFSIYKQAIKPTFMRLIPLWAGLDNSKTKDVSFESLYIHRSVIDYDENGEIKNTYSNPDVLTMPGDVSFIYGPAGSGKTQHLNFIASGVNDTYLPITVSCQKLNAYDGSVYDYLYDCFYDSIGREKPYSKENFARLIDTKNLLLLFDGMDEIADESATRRLVSRIEKFYKNIQDKSALIFTSRNKQDSNAVTLCGKSVSVYELKKLSETDAETLTGNLFVLFGNNKSKDDFFIRIKDLEDEIKSNPLLSTQLAIVYNESGDIPQNSFGILDAVADITLKVDKEKGVLETDFLRNIRKILKDFARERYTLRSNGREIDAVKIFKSILKDQYNDYEIKAEFLVNYLKNRAILVDGEFYHKMFLEYFTAVSFYDDIFGVYDELENGDILAELLSHYNDPYWSAVIKLFLVKADNLIDKNETVKLYEKTIELANVTDYVLLFDACRDLINHKKPAQITLVKDILYKSSEKIYPPYGPLFYYVPEYELYAETVKAAELLKGNAKALALTRDVCFIFGQLDEVGQVCPDVDGTELYNAAKPQLSGVRDALCELFFTGNTDFKGGDDIYPRCFNVGEAKSMKEHNHGLFGRMRLKYNDELNLWGESIPKINGNIIGFITLFKNDIILNGKNLISGLVIMYRFIDDKFPMFSFYKKHVRCIYVEENCNSKYNLSLEQFKEKVNLICEKNGIMYFRNVSNLIIPNEIHVIPKRTFVNCDKLKFLKLPDNIRKIVGGTCRNCINLKTVIIPSKVQQINGGAFLNCNLERVRIPIGTILDTTPHCSSFDEGVIIEQCKQNVVVSSFVFKTSKARELLKTKKESNNEEIAEIVSSKIKRGAYDGNTKLKKIVFDAPVTKICGNAFKNCINLTQIQLPDTVVSIVFEAFMGCLSLNRISFPTDLVHIGENAFNGCASLVDINIPEKVMFIGDGAFQNCNNLKSVTISYNFEDEIERIFGDIDRSIIHFI